MKMVRKIIRTYRSELIKDVDDFINTLTGENSYFDSVELEDVITKFKKLEQWGEGFNIDLDEEVQKEPEIVKEEDIPERLEIQKRMIHNAGELHTELVYNNPHKSCVLLEKICRDFEKYKKLGSVSNDAW